MGDFMIEEVANQPLKHAAEKIPNKYHEYLMYSKMRNQRLQELNRQHAARSNKFVQLEEGFSLYFNGANSQLSDRRASDKATAAIAPRKSRTSEERGKSAAERSKSAVERPTWGMATKLGFLTERGDRLFVRPPHYYSDDFDEADEGDDALAPDTAAVSVDLSLGDVRSLRRSLAVDGGGGGGGTSGLSPIAETPTNDDKIMRLQMPLDDQWSLSNTDSDDARLRQIVERVLRMDGAQQHKLLASLALADGVEVALLIDDNWGHPDAVGLTELEFWAADDRVLPITAVRGPDGPVDRLTDGKKQTRKDKHMWATKWLSRPVRLDCRVAACSVDELAAVALWNYNRSMDTLSMGARRVSVVCDGVALVSGASVDKALGNRAFNPPTVVRLRQSPSEGRHSVSSADDDDDDRCLMERFYGGSARFGRRSVAGGSRDELKQIVAEWDIPNAVSLEQSWTSLGFFDRSHAGRLDRSVQGGLIGAAPTGEQGDLLSADVVPLDILGDDKDAPFVIPELPRGGILRIDILSTWGDPHYVGLAGIELFAACGERVAVRSISARPSDINELPGYGSDPRVVSNLLDGVHRTRDDVHMWLAPFTGGQHHVVSLVLADPDTQLAMMRIWNYNKSRIHSSRGARDVEISLDGAPIFRGEIARATSDGDDEDVGGEVILFTSDDAILDLVGAHDTEFCRRLSDVPAECVPERPPTAREIVESADDTPVRPFTACANHSAATISPAGNTTIVRLELAASWGDERAIGLTGVEFITADGLVAAPIDIGDDGIERLFDGHNATTSEHHMWLTALPDNGGHYPTVTVVLACDAKAVAAMRVWNYNRSMEEARCGVRTLHVSINEHRVSPPDGLLLRRAPGHTQYDFAQRISLTGASGANDREDTPDISRTDLPCGFVFQLNLVSAWNDLYYIGLNGIELCDEHARPIHLQPQQVHAFPESVNCLMAPVKAIQQVVGHGNQLDVRTPDKLVDGINDTYDPKHMWLAPILPGCVNRLFIVFDRPVAISMLKLWNYSKTPARGVKDFSVLVDDLLIHSGTLPAAPSATVVRGILPQMSESVPQPSNSHRTVLFDRRNAALIVTEKRHILEQTVSGGQDVVLINDTGSVSSGQVANQKFRPLTSVKGKARHV